MRPMISFLLLVCISAVAHPARAASIPEACEATKQKVAGQLGKCLHGAEKKLATSGDTAKHTAEVGKCTAKFSAAWQAAEQKAADQGGACPTTSDGPTVLSAITAHVACVTSEITTGSSICLMCGNGVIDPGEDCDIGAPGGTCDAATGGAAKFGSVGCRADCTFDTSACSACPPSGQIVGGSCWVLSGADASCDAACSNVGLVYDSATMTYAGSAGSDANCSAVMIALGQSYGTIGSGGPPGGIGCWCNQATSCLRDTSFTTTSTASYVYGQRACACH